MTSDQAWVALAEVLGTAIPAGADAADVVKRARRKTHPDLGNGREQWDKVEQAAAVLGVL
jgi:hypothetical protein